MSEGHGKTDETGRRGTVGGLHRVKDLSPKQQDEVRLGSQDGMEKLVESQNIHWNNNE